MTNWETLKNYLEVEIELKKDRVYANLNNEVGNCVDNNFRHIVRDSNQVQEECAKILELQEILKIMDVIENGVEDETEED